MLHCLLRLIKITRKNKHYTNVRNSDKLITDIIFKSFIIVLLIKSGHLHYQPSAFLVQRK